MEANEEDKEELAIDMPAPGTKLVRLGHIILQSLPVTEAEGTAWLQLVAKTLPAEIFTTYSWLPIQPGKPH